MTDYLSRDDDFGMLSITDLLKARDEFHLHLVHKANVVGTAIGRYRIRKTDPLPGKGGETGGAKGVRTLENSEVRYYSWPAILVFVREWLDEHHFAPGGSVKPADFIPPAVYMSDGRKAPICVIKAELDDVRHQWEANYTFPTNLVGGGYPLVVDVQGQEHIASVGCLVTDGHTTYALTNRHVAGAPGTPIYTVIGGNRVEIGTASAKSLSRELFPALYDGWPGKNVYVDLDAALVEIHDVHRWTTQVYGVGQIGKLADLATDNLSLKLIGCPVRAFGAASREMHGEIAAMFYRFKSVGGFEFVSDFLIGPRAPSTSLGTHPGDSGTVWLIEVDAGKPPLPLALQWGGQVFVDGADAAGSSYALATSLSNVCARLEVDLIRDWNADQPDYWGTVGHYGIANMAIGHLSDGHLAKLMTANLERITFDIDAVTKKATSGLSKKDFVPLADVPDLVWKIGPYKRGGPKAPEHANHFADMDRKLKKPLPEGSTLLDICDKPAKLDVAIWQRYYDAVKKEHPTLDESRGLLPFRCWQIFDAMVYYVKQGDAERFVCVAGILSHYVGDACQPLHISYLFNGDPDRAKKGKVRSRTTGEMVDGMISYGAGVHGAYEDDMLDYHVDKLWPAVETALEKMPAGKLPANGKAAGWEVVTLMQKTFAKIKPMDIVELYKANEGETPKPMAQILWDEFGKDTEAVIAAGSDCLARLWQGAWNAGGGDRTIKALGKIPEDTLAAIYQPFSFLQSETLNSIKPVLDTGNGGADGSVFHEKTAHATKTPRKKRTSTARG
ncbi:hypothetical protein ABIA96_006610 [Bradyrhizobium sp. LB11.1]